MSRATDFDQVLRTAGIPIHGVNSAGVINFQASATQQQRTQAANLAASFDWTPRRQRAVAQIEADVETWLSTATAAQKVKALAWALTGAALANGQLDALKNLTNIDPTEPDV